MNSIVSFFSENFWATAASLGVVASMISGAIISKVNANKVWSQVIAWLVSIGLTVGAYFLDLVTVAEPTWLTLTMTGLLVGLASNGIYDIPAVKEFMYKVFGELPVKKLENVK